MSTITRVRFRVGDMLEKSLWTGIQVTVGALPATLGVIGESGALESPDAAVAVGKAATAAGLTAAIATLLSLVKNFVVESKPLTARSNLVSRLGWTFVIAAVSALPTAEIYLDLDFAQSALMAAVSAGIAATFSVAKNLTAEGVILETARRAELRVNVETKEPIG